MPDHGDDDQGKPQVAQYGEEGVHGETPLPEDQPPGGRRREEMTGVRAVRLGRQFNR
jgi:hypothetical protein